MKLQTLTRGDGPQRLALVHGLGNDGEIWNDLVEIALETGRFTITTVDLRGHGRSPRADRYTVTAFADDLVASLPTGLDAVVSHSLGGAVVARAVARLRPKQAVYLDPGFRLALPTDGVGGWLVRRVRLSLLLFTAVQSRGIRAPALTASGQALEAAARARWDRRMALGVLQDVGLQPVEVGPPVVPSTVVLSGDARYVVPDPLPEQLAAAGWGIRRLDDLGHALFLEDPERVWTVLDDLL